MKKIFEFIFGKTEAQETSKKGPQIQSSVFPERVGFNQWSESVHQACNAAFLRK